MLIEEHSKKGEASSEAADGGIKISFRDEQFWNDSRFINVNS